MRLCPPPPRATLLLGGGPLGSQQRTHGRRWQRSRVLGAFPSIDPYKAQARRDFPEARVHHLGRAKISPELVPEQNFPRSEYYFDFARHHERRHMIGDMAGMAEAIPIGLYRGESHRPAAGPDFAPNS
jgi:hypothetical protein